MLNIPEMAQNRAIKKIWLEETAMDARQPEGFTLIELLVVIAIISILALIGYGAFGFNTSANVDQAVTDISEDMQLARAEAIAQNVQYRIIFPPASSQVIADTVPPPAGVVFPPASNQYSIENSVPYTSSWNALKTVTLPHGVIFGIGNATFFNNDPVKSSTGIDFAGNMVTFNTAGGLLYFNNTGTVYVVASADVGSGNPNRVRAAQVQYFATGIVQSWLWNGVGWQTY